MITHLLQIDYFLHNSYATAEEFLRKAIQSGHHVSEYLSCVLKVLHPDDDTIRQDGAIRLQSYEDTVNGTKYKQECRWKVHEIITAMGIHRLEFIHRIKDRIHLPGRCGFLPVCWSCTAGREINILFTTKPWLRI